MASICEWLCFSTKVEKVWIPPSLNEQSTEEECHDYFIKALQKKLMGVEFANETLKIFQICNKKMKKLHLLLDMPLTKTALDTIVQYLNNLEEIHCDAVGDIRNSDFACFNGCQKLRILELNRCSNYITEACIDELVLPELTTLKINWDLFASPFVPDLQVGIDAQKMIRARGYEKKRSCQEQLPQLKELIYSLCAVQDILYPEIIDISIHDDDQKEPIRVESNRIPIRSLQSKESGESFSF